MIDWMKRVGLIYSDTYLKHETWNHPESPDRLRAIMEGLRSSGLYGQLTAIPPREATEDDLARIHTDSHIGMIRRTAETARAQLDGDTQTSGDSYRAALLAVGGLCEAVDQVHSGKLDSAFAMVRPPGHHAERDRAMGFCLFNNIAIAAEYARVKYKLERVLIVDWDVHHGNGTQHSFYESPNCFYVSTHQYPFYPGTGHYRESGSKEGAGFTLNVPLPGGQGDEEYRAVFDEIIVPAAMEYGPELVMISAGFDAHGDDPLGGMKLTGTGFAYMTRRLMEVADASAGGKVVLALEGGYSMEGLKESTQAVLRELLGMGSGEVPSVGKEIKEYVDTVKKHFRTYWKTL